MLAILSDFKRSKKCFDVKMVKNCCIIGCSSSSIKNSNFSFYLLPNAENEKERRKQWLTAIGRAHVLSDGSVDTTKLWDPNSPYHYVCSKHFISGKIYCVYNVTLYFNYVLFTLHFANNCCVYVRLFI